ncbi:hypothetical protein M9435_002785 [Picochlorum sp. BPE23]|nr:hypothetical protein M9435_002785 [Picochlorum sp. BPE23]|eukprot:jgi/Picre1/34666/NNA_002134.t1
MGDASSHKLINIILRAIELLFSIIAFAVVAEYDGTSKINYMIFTGVTSMVICLVFLVLYFANLGDSPTIVLIELVINVIWWVFWLAAAAVMSSLVNESWSNSRIEASCAFSWLTWFAWTVSTVMSFLATKNRSGPSGGSTPSGPQTNMV